VITMTRTAPTTDGVLAHGGARRFASHGWIILALVSACQFMVILDAAIVNVALPSIRRDLGFTPTGLAWVVNGYLLTLGGLLLVGGRASDILGHRRMLVVGLGGFSLASMIAGLAQTQQTLVCARLVQGAGAALLVPATLAVINLSFTQPHQRARALGAWSAAGGVGGMAGALVGGALTSGLSWRWVFLVNVPIGAMLVIVAWRELSTGSVARRGSLDLSGGLLGTTGLGAFIYGVMQSASHDWSAPEVLTPLVGGLALLTAFVVFEQRVATRPMVPPGLFRNRGVAVGNAMLFVFGAIPIAMWYFTSLLLQNVLGASALEAGLEQTPAAVVFALVARGAARSTERWGVRAVLLAGCALLVAGFAWLARTGAGDTYLQGVLGPTLLVAAGIGLVFPTLIAAATLDVETEAGTVAGLANTSIQIGGSVGLALLATTSATVAGPVTDHLAIADLAAGYDQVFLAAAVTGMALAALSRLLVKRD